jgi:anti-sigma regulatory factor (Ser/Thr protein kinase)
LSYQDPELKKCLGVLELEVTTGLENLAGIRDFVADVCQRFSETIWSLGSLMKLQLAATEVASNIMRHAYHGARDGRLYVTGHVWSDRILIRFRHCGDRFAPPATVLPPTGLQEGGMGLFIIENSVDRVNYSYSVDGENLVEIEQWQDKEKGERHGS